MFLCINIDVFCYVQLLLHWDITKYMINTLHTKKKILNSNIFGPRDSEKGRWICNGSY